MRIIVVSHPSRVEWANRIAAHLPVDLIVIDDVSAASGHRKAMASAMQTDERVVVMEDDAIPVVGFLERAQAWFERCPDDLISFYLGTGRPRQYQPYIDIATRQADDRGDDFIRFRQLLHGVCYSLPPGAPERVLVSMTRREADFAIGTAWGKPVVYPVESLVEHRDTMPVEQHPDGRPRVERRVARRLAAELMYEP